MDVAWTVGCRIPESIVPPQNVVSCWRLVPWNPSYARCTRSLSWRMQPEENGHIICAQDEG